MDSTWIPTQIHATAANTLAIAIIMIGPVSAAPTK
jgi:hypothetical protein